MDHSVDRVLDLLGSAGRRWRGVGREPLDEPRLKLRVVAFQGERGAFSEEAARQILGPAMIPCALPAFRGYFPPSQRWASSRAVVPIENTLAGSVHENYDHLLHFELPIVAETSVRIVHNLIAAQGVKFCQNKAGFFPSGSAESMPGIFRAQSADRGSSFLRHGRQRQDAHGRRA